MSFDREAPADVAGATLTVEIESDGVNPATYKVPAGAALVWTDWGDSGSTVTIEGPYEGELPEPDGD